MAKTDIDRHTNKFAPPFDRYRRYILQDNFDKMDRDANSERPKERIEGPKTVAINAYLEGGRNFAYNCMQEKYKRSNGESAFSKEQIDMWIDDYEEKKKKERDDDDAR